MPAKADAVWNELVREAGLVETERAANVAVADAERELARAGFDVEAERAAAEERIRAVVESLPPEAPAKSPAARGRRDLWLFIASFGALIACAVVAGLQSNPANSDDGSARPASSNATPAEALRDEAARACRQQLWGPCAEKLDQAKALDPQGEGQERVRGLRRAIAEH